MIPYLFIFYPPLIMELRNIDVIRVVEGYLLLLIPNTLIVRFKEESIMYWNENSFNQPVQEDTHVDDIPLEEGVDDGEPLNMESLIETFVVDTVARMDDDNRKAFMESDSFKQMCEAGLLEARSIMRLNQEDDFTRRVKVAAIAKAHANNDALEIALRKNRKQEKALLDKIYKKYSTQVKRDVQMAQRRMKQINPQVFNTLRAIR